MKTVKTFRIIPALTHRLQALATIAGNMWWSWNPNAIDLFRRLDIEGFGETGHNPTALLGKLNKKKLTELENDISFLSHLDRVEVELTTYLKARTWFQDNHEDKKDMGIAYFSAEYGLHESLPIYSGGLGVLSGDHLKSASDLGLPLYGVGLLYRQGYFRQYLSADGWQQEIYPENDFYNLPLSLEKDENDDPLLVEVELPDKILYAQVWRVNIGRIELFLLDANIERNGHEERMITSQLYGGDKETRIKQEMLLGIGGIRTLEKLELNIHVFHMNEGHSAFLALERIRCFMEKKGITLKEAIQIVQATNIFTTHTPVSAGIDRFDSKMVLRYLHPIQKKIGMTDDELLNLGSEHNGEDHQVFSMASLAIRLASYCNGVSKLHGKVSRKMWKNMWPNIPIEEIPIDYITNGIHIKSWMSDEMSRLFDRYIGPTWREQYRFDDLTNRVSSIPNSELWRSKERLRERLVTFARSKLKKNLVDTGAARSEIERADEVLDPEALTIGFARRFATYKRATLIFRDPKRLAGILNNKERPVQLIFAGKAHPQDMHGKEFIKEIIHLARKEEFHNRLIFIEDYDLNIARYIVQGVDVWLNTPQRPHEASGTSGMKVPINAGINLSILDGWWDEGYNRKNGWAIGHGEVYDDIEYQDRIEGEALLDLLEKDVVPAFYERGPDDLPRQWIEIMKNSMISVVPVFNTYRMVKEYMEKFYVHSYRNYKNLYENDFQKTRNLANWFRRIEKYWQEIRIHKIYHEHTEDLTIGEEIEIKAEIQPGKLHRKEIRVELIYGLVGPHGEPVNTTFLGMKYLSKMDEETFLYSVKIRCDISGNFGYSVRVLPCNGDFPRKMEPGFITWA